MKHAVAAVLTTIFILTGMLVIIFLGQGKANGQPDPALPTLTLPGVTVTLPQITLPPVTIKVPGPTVRVTVPGPTVHAPGPTKTVTVNNSGPVVPGPTHTVTIKQRAKTPGSATGQHHVRRVTITPSPQVRNHTVTVTHQKTNTIVHRVFIGSLVAIGLLLLAILAGIGGYYFGYRDSDKREQNFLQSLIQRVRGEHS